MGKLAFLIVLLVLILVPPASRVTDPLACIGICMDAAAPAETIVLDTEDGS
jgi:hypothetical protein